MAEKLDCVTNNRKMTNHIDFYNIFSSNLDLVNNEVELQEELIYLRKARNIKKSNDEMAALVSQLEDFESTCNFIIDRKIDLRKKLKSPDVPNAIPIKYNQQENFVTCCQNLPAIISFLESVKRKVNNYHFLNSQQVVSHMEKEMQFGKEYCNHVKYFLSSKEGFLKNINAVVALLHGNAVQHVTWNVKNNSD